MPNLSEDDGDIERFVIDLRTDTPVQILSDIEDLLGILLSLENGLDAGQTQAVRQMETLAANVSAELRDETRP